MKNIEIKTNGQCVTIHTPHGQVVVRVYGGEGFNMNETRVTVVGSCDGNHFIETNKLEAPIVFPEKEGNIYPVRVRHRGAIQMKEMGPADNPTALGRVALDWVKQRREKGLA